MNIFLADAQPKVRFGLRVLLERRSGLEVLGEAANADDLLDQVAGSCPDLVLLSWELPGRDGGDLVSALRKVCPSLRVIAISGRPEARQAALSAGADAFVSKADPPEQLLATLEDYGCAVHRKEAE